MIRMDLLTECKVWILGELCHFIIKFLGILTIIITTIQHWKYEKVEEEKSWIKFF